MCVHIYVYIHVCVNVCTHMIVCVPMYMTNLEEER